MCQSEEQSILEEFTPAFYVKEPISPLTPFVFCSPHSGSKYSRYFLRKSRLESRSLRKSEDLYVDELFSRAAAQGAPLIAALFPRAYVDVNREPYELDPELFSENLPDWANARSIRVAGGLGTIARLVGDGEEIYDEPLFLKDALFRIEKLYKPFHNSLNSLIERAQNLFGYSILIDCHSMPSGQTSGSTYGKPDFVIGDRFGTSCDKRLTRYVQNLLNQLGYVVQVNRPYAGGYITEHYGKPRHGFHSLQIEVNRGLYVDEKSFQKKQEFSLLEKNLVCMAKNLFLEIPLLMERRSAAE